MHVARYLGVLRCGKAEEVSKMQITVDGLTGELAELKMELAMAAERNAEVALTAGKCHLEHGSELCCDGRKRAGWRRGSKMLEVEYYGEEGVRCWWMECNGRGGSMMQEE